MPVRKYVKKVARKGARYAKKRYVTRTGGYRVNKIASDIMKIKRQLNVEHKHYDFKFGSGQPIAAQEPVNNDPIFLNLLLPSRGVAYNQRVGNQIRITHITTKLEFLFKNNNDLFSRTTASVRLLFAKAGDDVPAIEDLYELDSNGHYTRNSFVNTQTWKKYTWIKALNSFKSHTDQVSRYPLSNSNANTADPDGVTTVITEVDTVANTPLNLSKYYINKQTKCSIRVNFENGSDTIVTQMKPYLLFMADSPTQGTGVNLKVFDPVSISGTVRFTYVDN